MTFDLKIENKCLTSVAYQTLPSMFSSQNNSARWVVVSLFYRQGTEAWRSKGNCPESCKVSDGPEAPVAPKSLPNFSLVGS